MRLASILIIPISLLFAFVSNAQVSIPGVYLQEINKLKDTASIALYPSVTNNSSSSLYMLPFSWKSTYNSTYPRGFNDGPVWKGKGLTNEIHFGIQGKKGKFSYTLHPTLFHSQNKPFFQIDDAPSYRYQYSNRIDWVQRYGSSSFYQFHPGQSELRFQTGHLLIAASTQNYSLGPSNFNPIILSRQGGGFPHLRIGNQPANIKNFGKVEANLIMGILSESEYFDGDTENDNRYLNILSIGYSPSFLPELKVGFNKSLYKQFQYFKTRDLFSTLIVLDDGIINGDTLPNDSFDQIASITMDWNIKEYGFRVYAEFSKNDFTSDGAGIRPTLVEPEHTRAFTIGYEKTVRTKKDRLIQFGYEHTTLSRNAAFLWRPTPSFYTHSINRNGYSNKGQLIGAGIGPGGNSDHFSIQTNYSKLKAAILLQRIEYNRDYFTASVLNSNAHNIEYTASWFLQKEIQRMVLALDASIGIHYNRDYIPFRNDFFANLGFSIQYSLAK